jgi:hypothetical protein
MRGNSSAYGQLRRQSFASGAHVLYVRSAPVLAFPSICLIIWRVIGH